MSYLIPAPYTGMSSRDAHLRRNPPSGEPGTDYYMPTGTPLAAPADCRVVDIGGGIDPATGRYITVDDGTRWMRFLHNSEIVASLGQDLARGQYFALSGASGYGSEFFGEPYRNDAFWANTGGDHVHVTAFRGRGYTFGSSGTVDFHALTGGVAAGGGFSQEDDLDADDKNKLNYIYNALSKPYGDQLTAIINVIRGEIAPQIASIAAGGILFPGQPYNGLVAIVNAVRAEQGQGDLDIDEVELAANLAPALAPLIAENLGTLTDQTVNDLVKRLLDEQAKRLAG